MSLTTKTEVDGDTTYWIRPWYPAGVNVHTGQIVGHLDPECEELLKVEPTPREGAGWLDPRTGDTCEPCLRNHDPELYAALYGQNGAAA
jgi:hypothetical protein